MMDMTWLTLSFLLLAGSIIWTVSYWIKAAKRTAVQNLKAFQSKPTTPSLVDQQGLRLMTEQEMHDSVIESEWRAAVDENIRKRRTNQTTSA